MADEPRRWPTVTELRIAAAIVLLGFWIVLTVVDTFAPAYRIDPFVNATAGAAVAWLFGSGIKGGS